MNGAHIDSPRLDLKPNPLFEQADIAYLKPHYYGGIRKYQWGATPLAMHGVVGKKNGEMVEISIGEKRRRAPVLHHRPSPPPGLWSRMEESWARA